MDATAGTRPSGSLWRTSWTGSGILSMIKCSSGSEEERASGALLPQGERPEGLPSGGRHATRRVSVEDGTAMGEGQSSTSKSSVILRTWRLPSSASVLLASSCWTKVRSSARNYSASSAFIGTNSSLTDETNSSFCPFIKVLISSSRHGEDECRVHRDWRNQRQKG